MLNIIIIKLSLQTLFLPQPAHVLSDIKKVFGLHN